MTQIQTNTEKVPKTRKKKNNNYFTSETDEYIVLYNNETDPAKKSKIFQDHLYYPFFKLTQNIIHTFKFYYLDVDTIEDLQHEIIIYILSKLHLFNPNLGTKGYSYFGTAIKRWLINYNRQNYKKLIHKQDSNTIKDDIKFSYELLNNNNQQKQFFDKFVDYCEENIFELLQKPKQKEIAEALLSIFRSRDIIDIIHKKAINIYVKQYVDVKTTQITAVIKIFNDLLKEYTLLNKHIY